MKEEEIRQRSVFNRYLELVAEDVKTIFADRSHFTKGGRPVDIPKWFQLTYESSGEED